VIGKILCVVAPVCSYPRRAADDRWLNEILAIELGSPQIAVAIPFLALMGG
jgi:hypothetical protein